MDQETVQMDGNDGDMGERGPPGHAASPTQVSEEDRLVAENLALRAQVLVLSKEKFLLEVGSRLQGFDAQLAETQKNIRALQVHLADVYGIDWTKQQVEPGTGRIIPAP